MINILRVIYTGTNGVCIVRTTSRVSPPLGYDHGDCCKDSCIDAEFVCGVESPFICRDPEYLDDDSDTSFSFKYSCSDNLIGNGYCDSENNNEGCGMFVGAIDKTC